jgi:DNA-3-methyladenine glycosylase II
VLVRRFRIDVPAPFRLDLTVWTLRRRPHNLVDRWDGTSYQRILTVGDRPVEVAVRQEQDRVVPRLTVELRGTGPPLGDRCVTEARRVLGRTLGLGVDLEGFWRLAESDGRLAALAGRFAGTRPPCFPTVFEAVVNAVACQQLSLTVGIHFLNRLAQRYGPTLRTRTGPAFGFPTPERLAGADPEALRNLGFSRPKARAVMVLARQVAAGDVDLEALRDAADDHAVAALVDLVGVGRWSAEYTLLRGLQRWHVLPGDDIGARNNLQRRFGLAPSGGYDAVAQLSRAWWPYGGLVYFHLLLDTLADGGQVTPSAPPSTARRAR